MTNILSRTITGILIILFGLILIFISFFNSFIILIYAIPIFIIGIFILLNKNEDKIEKIKMKGGRKK